jgi:hypothetical protein
LQAFNIESKGSAACGSFIAVTAGDGDNELSGLLIDGNSRIRTKEIRHSNIADLYQSRVVGAGEFRAGVASGRDVVQADSRDGTLANDYTAGVHTGRNRSLSLEDLTDREHIEPGT